MHNNYDWSNPQPFWNPVSETSPEEMIASISAEIESIERNLAEQNLLLEVLKAKRDQCLSLMQQAYAELN